MQKDPNYSNNIVQNEFANPSFTNFDCLSTPSQTYYGNSSNEMNNYSNFNCMSPIIQYPIVQSPIEQSLMNQSLMNQSLMNQSLMNQSQIDHSTYTSNQLFQQFNQPFIQPIYQMSDQFDLINRLNNGPTCFGISCSTPVYPTEYNFNSNTYNQTSFDYNSTSNINQQQEYNSNHLTIDDRMSVLSELISSSITGEQTEPIVSELINNNENKKNETPNTDCNHIFDKINAQNNEKQIEDEVEQSEKLQEEDKKKSILCDLIDEVVDQISNENKDDLANGDEIRTDHNNSKNKLENDFKPTEHTYECEDHDVENNLDNDVDNQNNKSSKDELQSNEFNQLEIYDSDKSIDQSIVEIHDPNNVLVEENRLVPNDKLNKNKKKNNVNNLNNPQNRYNALEIFKLIEYTKVNCYINSSGELRMDWSDFETYQLNPRKSIRGIRQKNCRLNIFDNYLPAKYKMNLLTLKDFKERKDKLKGEYKRLYDALIKFDVDGEPIDPLNYNISFCDLKIHGVRYKLKDFYDAWKIGYKNHKLIESILNYVPSSRKLNRATRPLFDQLTNELTQSFATKNRTLDQLLVCVSNDNSMYEEQNDQIGKKSKRVCEEMNLNPSKKSKSSKDKLILSTDHTSSLDNEPPNNYEDIKIVYESLRELLQDIFSICKDSKLKDLIKLSNEVLAINVLLKNYLHQVQSIYSMPYSSLSIQIKLVNITYTELLDKIQKLTAINRRNYKFPKHLISKVSRIRNELNFLIKEFRNDSIQSLQRIKQIQDLEQTNFFNMYQLIGLYVINLILDNVDNF